jgi:hypothetical protein
MTIDLMFASSPTFLEERPSAWRRGVYTDEGLGDRHGIKLENGKWLSVQPNGTFEERDSPKGPYEWFALDPSLNVVKVTPRLVTFAIPVREV